MSRRHVPTLRTLALILASLAAPAAASGADLARNPVCDRIAGETLAQTPQWRIIELGRGSEKPALAAPEIYACSRTRPGPARVRRLSSRSRSVRVHEIVGDVALVDHDHGGYVHGLLVDLRRGRSREVWTAKESTDRFRSSSTHALTASGAYVSARWETGEAGPLEVLDASGRRPLGLFVKEVQPSRGSGLADSGVYYEAADGSLGRLTLSGPIAPGLFGLDRSLRVRKVRLLARPRWAAPGRRELYVDADTRIQVVLGDAPAIVRTEAGKPAVRLALAAGAADSAVFMTWHAGAAVVGAEFADRPGERRIRTLSSSPGMPVLDAPSSPHAEQSGNVADVDGVALAIGYENGLHVWRQLGGWRVWDYPQWAGAHDFAQADRGAFYTTGAGEVRRVAVH